MGSVKLETAYWPLPTKAFSSISASIPTALTRTADLTLCSRQACSTEDRKSSSVNSLTKSLSQDNWVIIRLLLKK